ncbi:MAG: YMGG-like glycine zipper-containing protein [Candidatus Omnitrophica bacterium]|nr:YMGG-like glycine zipper-containing protein [Candidatus Omnitrophota bacterium]
MMKKMGMLIPSLFIVFLIGCTTTQKSAAVGTLGGATVGGIVGHQSGHGKEGAAIGAAAGALGGYVVGERISVKKFCPTCGRQYDESVQYCPKDGTALKVVEK